MIIESFFGVAGIMHGMLLCMFELTARAACIAWRAQESEYRDAILLRY